MGWWKLNKEIFHIDEFLSKNFTSEGTTAIRGFTSVYKMEQVFRLLFRCWEGGRMDPLWKIREPIYENHHPTTNNLFLPSCDGRWNIRGIYRWSRWMVNLDLLRKRVTTLKVLCSTVRGWIKNHKGRRSHIEVMKDMLVGSGQCEIKNRGCGRLKYRPKRVFLRQKFSCTKSWGPLWETWLNDLGNVCRPLSWDWSKIVWYYFWSSYLR